MTNAKGTEENEPRIRGETEERDETKVGHVNESLLLFSLSLSLSLSLSVERSRFPATLPGDSTGGALPL